MAEPTLRILQVSTTDVGGGAEQVARDLFRGLRKRNLPCWLAVGRRRTAEPNVLLIPNDALRDWPARGWAAASGVLCRLLGRRWPLARLLAPYACALGQPSRLLALLRGHEDFDYPATKRLLTLPPQRPDVVHCHNLHGAYFNLRELPRLSRQVPVVLTLHDEWLLTGHCAFTLGCGRWRTGCGRCPHLRVYPPLLRDGTNTNWLRRRRIYTRSRLHVATPARWLMSEVERSVLAPAIVEGRVIPYGIDLDVFRPGDRQAARAALGLPADAHVLLYATAVGRLNPFKDYATLERAMERLAARAPGRPPIVCVALGGEAPVRRCGVVEIRYVGFQRSREVMAQYYRAADLYVHAARAETTPLVILEALACGTPVVATAVGGIAEQVRSTVAAGGALTCGEHSAELANGALVPPGDDEAMAAAIDRLLADEQLRRRLGGNAAEDARARFGIDRQVDAYLQWYREIAAR